MREVHTKTHKGAAFIHEPPSASGKTFLQAYTTRDEMLEQRFDIFVSTTHARTGN